MKVCNFRSLDETFIFKFQRELLCKNLNSQFADKFTRQTKYLFKIAGRKRRRRALLRWRKTFFLIFSRSYFKSSKSSKARKRVILFYRLSLLFFLQIIKPFPFIPFTLCGIIFRAENTIFPILDKRSPLDSKI